MDLLLWLLVADCIGFSLVMIIVVFVHVVSGWDNDDD